MNKQQVRKLIKLYFVDNRKTTLLGLPMIWAGFGIISLALPDSFTHEALAKFNLREFADACFKGFISIVGGAGLIISKDAHVGDQTGPVASVDGPIPESSVVPDNELGGPAPKA
jgi:hypothetical protein